MVYSVNSGKKCKELVYPTSKEAFSSCRYLLKAIKQAIYKYGSLSTVASTGACGASDGSSILPGCPLNKGNKEVS